MINSLKRFNKEGAEDLYVTEGGFMLTKWEHKELLKEQRIREKKLKEELQQLKEPSPYSNAGASRYEMGSERARQLEEMLNTTNIQMLERATDLTRFEELRKRIHRLGSEDYYTRANIRFKKNYLETLERYRGYDNYKKLISQLKKIRNPEEFYKLISNSALGMDVFTFYDENFTQDEFNNLAYDLGVDESKLQ